MADISDPRSDGRSLWERLLRWRGLAGESEDEETGEESREAADGNERTLIENVLRLKTLSAADVMIPRVDIVAVEVETPFRDLVRLMVEEGHSRLPVYKDDLDHVIGMVHVKDVLAFVAAGRTTTLQKMARKALFVAPSTRLLDLLSQMRQQRVHMAFVVDEFGGIDGLITIEDLVEEIVGDIEDEHDEAEPAHIMERPDGSLIVDARTPIGELEERLELKLLTQEAAEEVDTVGGLIFMLAGQVPGRGEIIPHAAGLEFEVLDADQRRVRRLRVRRPAAPADDLLDDG
ncbi:MAG TPA: hemolysin family protein [Aliidongia sp.]|nr:hemolysin family protein [Aliidongia sp.]